MTGAKGNKILDFGAGAGFRSEDTEGFLGGLVCGLGAAILDSPVRGWVARGEGGIGNSMGAGESFVLRTETLPVPLS